MKKYFEMLFKTMKSHKNKSKRECLNKLIREKKIPHNKIIYNTLDAYIKGSTYIQYDKPIPFIK